MIPWGTMVPQGMILREPWFSRVLYYGSYGSPGYDTIGTMVPQPWALREYYQINLDSPMLS